MALSGVDTAAVKIDGNTVSVAEAGSMLMLPGAHTVEVSGQDKAGNGAIPVARTYTTYGVAKVGNDVVVVGTGLDDTILIDTTNPAHVAVTTTTNGVTTAWPTFALDPLIAHIIAYGLAGNDNIAVLGGVSGELHGGAGNDTITGGAGHDLIFGDAGDDSLTGGAGNDFLIGGAGADRLVGSAGNDILASGDFEATIQGLRDLRAYWADKAVSTDESAAVDTIFAQDGAADILTGNAGADWFIISGGDRITDLAAKLKEPPCASPRPAPMTPAPHGPPPWIGRTLNWRARYLLIFRTSV